MVNIDSVGEGGKRLHVLSPVSAGGKFNGMFSVHSALASCRVDNRQAKDSCGHPSCFVVLSYLERRVGASERKTQPSRLLCRTKVDLCDTRWTDSRKKPMGELVSPA